MWPLCHNRRGHDHRALLLTKIICHDILQDMREMMLKAMRQHGLRMRRDSGLQQGKEVKLDMEEQFSQIEEETPSVPEPKTTTEIPDGSTNIKDKNEDFIEVITIESEEDDGETVEEIAAFLRSTNPDNGSQTDTSSISSSTTTDQPREKTDLDLLAVGGDQCLVCGTRFPKRTNPSHAMIVISHYVMHVHEELSAQLPSVPPFSCPRCDCAPFQRRHHLLVHYGWQHAVVPGMIKQTIDRVYSIPRNLKLKVDDWTQCIDGCGMVFHNHTMKLREPQNRSRIRERGHRLNEGFEPIF